MIAALTLATALVVPPPDGFAPSTANAFREGVAHVTYYRAADTAWMHGFLGMDGRWVVPPTRRGQGGLHAHEGYLRVRDGRGYQFLDPAGRLRFSLGQPYAGDVHDGRVAFQDGGLMGWNARMGYADTTGKVVVPPRFEFAGDFSHGVAVVKQGEQFGLVDRDGKLVLPIAHDFVKNAGDGLVSVTTGGKSWVADAKGQRAIARDFQGVGTFRDGRGLVVELGDPAELTTIIDRAGQPVGQKHRGVGAEFSDGMLPFQVGGKWGYIDAAGTVAIPARYQFAFDFTEGLAAVQEGGSWGFVDKAGKAVIPPQFALASSFSQGLACVKIGDRAAFVDRQGRVAIDLGRADGFSPN